MSVVFSPHHIGAASGKIIFRHYQSKKEDSESLPSRQVNKFIVKINFTLINQIINLKYIIYRYFYMVMGVIAKSKFQKYSKTQMEKCGCHLVC